MEALRKHIIERIETLKNKHHYDYGFTCREEIIYGLDELKRLANKMRIDVTPYSFNYPDWLNLPDWYKHE